MAYRNDIEALEARLEDLKDQVGERTRERDEVAALLAEARARDNAERYAAEAPQRQRQRQRIIIAVIAALGVVVGIVLAFRAARDKEAPFAIAMAKFQQFTDQMCACRDATCAQKVSDDMSKWANEMAKQYKDSTKPTEAQAKQAAELGEKMAKCMQKAMTAESPPADPSPNQRSPEGE